MKRSMGHRGAYFLEEADTIDVVEGQSSEDTKGGPGGIRTRIPLAKGGGYDYLVTGPSSLTVAPISSPSC